jgi:hypothetical protein
MHHTIVFAPKKVAVERRASATAWAKRQHPGATKVTAIDTFEAAVARTVALRERNEQATLLLNPSDLHPAKDDVQISNQEWSEACIAFLDTNSITYVIQGKQAASPRKSVSEAISGFIRATKRVTERVRAMLTSERQLIRAKVDGYLCGRPPYGYSIVDGKFAINEEQAAAVKFIFTRVRAGDNPTELTSKLTAEYAIGGVIKGKAQFWDRVKVRRILKNARLYCLGEYCGGRLTKPVYLPGNAFLPPEWVGTRFPAHGSASQPQTIKEIA